MTVSIIIAVKKWQSNLEECVASCLRLDYRDIEVLVLPDEHPGQGTIGQKDSRLKIIPSGPVNPAAKRDLALEQARGQILAFLDDDAYPDKHWLSFALENFSDPLVAAVGGPAVTPPQDSLMSVAGGLVYSSPLVSGKFAYRYVPRKREEVDDYPSCNFLVRKEVMLALGGFKTEFWPGEDTKLCLEITRKLGKKIIYDPKALVYHHRRRLFAPHLKQVAGYALHRGYFVKAFPETSRRISYFMPSLLLISLVIGLFLSVASVAIKTVYFSALAIYLAIVLLYSLLRGLRFALPVFLGIIATHLVYGFYFIKGLLARNLKN